MDPMLLVESEVRAALAESEVLTLKEARAESLASKEFEVRANIAEQRVKELVDLLGKVQAENTSLKERIAVLSATKTVPKVIQPKEPQKAPSISIRVERDDLGRIRSMNAVEQYA